MLPHINCSDIYHSLDAAGSLYVGLNPHITSKHDIQHSKKLEKAALAFKKALDGKGNTDVARYEAST